MLRELRINAITAYHSEPEAEESAFYPPEKQMLRGRLSMTDSGHHRHRNFLTLWFSVSHRGAVVIHSLHCEEFSCRTNTSIAMAM
jgi:hypothetical protein